MIQYAVPSVENLSRHGLLDAPLSRGMTKCMTPPDLPTELKAALDARLQGFSRNDAAERAALISRTYRDGGGSGAIRSEADALAYTLARMPATYAAVIASLNALREVRPEFAPKSLLDIGAGPGTAAWAAVEAFPSLHDFTLLDANSALRALALDLAGGSTRLRDITYRQGEARAALKDTEAADLVVASYMIGELGNTEQTALADLMWAKTRDTLLIVEPGTPAGYARIVAARERLIASGAHVAAPCPHDGQCPLKAPDWCHFTQRLPRSRAHKQVKGVALPFEDEKFSYLVLSRELPVRRASRILAPPDVTKATVVTKLCTANGLAFETVQRRDKSTYNQARKRRWGEISDGNGTGVDG
jgi:ribosomal protein RSM22 (predicted rRNA methylase)